MPHTPKIFQTLHIYFTKSEEVSRYILHSSLLCLRNHATKSSDVTSLLASVFDIIGKNTESKDAVTAALTEIIQAWQLYHSLIIVLFSLLCLLFPILFPLLFLLFIYLYITSLLIRLIIPPYQLREPLIPHIKLRELTSAYSTLYYQSPLFFARIDYAFMDYSAMLFSAIRIPTYWCQPSVQLSNKIHCFSKLNRKL